MVVPATHSGAWCLPLSKWRTQVHIAGQVALVQMDVAHDHHVGGVAEDAPKTLDLPTVAEVLGRVRVPELVCSNPETDVVADAAEKLRHRERTHRPSVGQDKQVSAVCLRAPTVEVADQFPA